MTTMRPGNFCRELLVALEASEGRRRRRKRDTSADAIGLTIKRELLEATIERDPEPEHFEGWLLECTLHAGAGNGGVRAMAINIWDEWKLANTGDAYRNWLAHGAPSDDREPARRNGR
ncbi:MAG TPA: hypothetical protein VMM77_04640 [Gemmatimonadaceae bacterium]|nr:hypothetical protein [Gemmatimonadaceae bacterium]